MDWALIEQKLESLRRSILRVKDKCHLSPYTEAAQATLY